LDKLFSIATSFLYSLTHWSDVFLNFSDIVDQRYQLT